MEEAPEQGVIGNGQMLATIGKHGELRYLFWPTIDYPQHVLSSLPGIYYSNKKGNGFGWFTDPPWEKKQEYIENTNILLTSFNNLEINLDVKTTDFILQDKDVFVRNFTFKNNSDENIFIRFFYYNDIAILESNIDDVAYYLGKEDAIIHYKRNYYFLYGSNKRSSGHQCGVHGESSDSFCDVYDYELSGGSLVLYDGTREVNSCLSWDMELQGKGSDNLEVIIIMGSSEKDVLRLLKESRKINSETLQKRTQNFWEGWIKNFKYDSGDEILNRFLKRSLLLFKLSIDRNHGGIVAAPCMYPEYRFCWPRDATYVAYSLDKCGFNDEAEKFYKWCKRAQEPEGGLYQRYYIEAKIKGPCWSSQIDEIATVIWGIGKHFDLTADKDFIKSMWPTVKKAADFFCSKRNSNTDLIESVGLWEEKFGSHTYTNAAVYSALKKSARIAELFDLDLSEKWNYIADKIKTSLLKLAWNSKLDRFIKTISPKDEGIDVSLLGLAFPFELLPVDDERMKKTALAIERSFNYASDGIGRYSDDVYYGGNPWILTTLWLALYYGKLGDVNKTKHLVTWSINHATELNLFPEQVDKITGKPISSIPLSWSHAFFILAIESLKEYDSKNKSKNPFDSG